MKKQNTTENHREFASCVFPKVTYVNKNGEQREDFPFQTSSVPSFNTVFCLRRSYWVSQPCSVCGTCITSSERLQSEVIETMFPFVDLFSNAEADASVQEQYHRDM